MLKQDTASCSRYQYAATNSAGTCLMKGGQELDISTLVATRGASYVERFCNWTGEREWLIIHNKKYSFVSNKAPLKGGDA